jgi:primosomal protein N' (replication factor Y)
MYFYEVYVADKTYKGRKPLSYHSTEKLPICTIVSVPIKNKTVPGAISAEIEKPKFTTKSLTAYASLGILPRELMELRDWIQAYYPAGSGEVTQLLLPTKIPKILPEISDTPASLPNITLPPSTPEQLEVLRRIISPDTYLLHGETGSGKTHIYLELALRQFRERRSSIILTPEIGLTPQLVQSFERRFGTENVVLIHSQLTEKTRFTNWLKILRASQPLVILGPRSALFAPVKNLGLIILDEAHESSYKQEQAPHYHASKVAAKLASLHRSILVLGSATPLVTDYFLAEARQKPILRMQASAKQGAFERPTISVVDLKDHAKFSKQPHLSDELLAAIQKSLQNGEQSLVFLNRRGTARVVICQDCGWQAACPHCDLPLTYHGDSHTMRCHTCGFTQAALTSCPSCGSANIVMKSIGTKAIVDELSKNFPEARIQRFDNDNKKAERLEAHYHTVSAGDVDIIVGTQIIAKGLDLPKLSTVGVVIADTSLYLPDYTAQEKSYQLLRQVIGRVGRGHRASTVIVQTYDPGSRLIRDAIRGSWEDFYQNELLERQKFLFPPYCHTLKLVCRRATARSAQTAVQKFADTLRQNQRRIIVDGPMPSYHEKIGDKYQWQLILKSKNRADLLEVIASLPANWNFDIDPLNLL